MKPPSDVTFLYRLIATPHERTRQMETAQLTKLQEPLEKETRVEINFMSVE